MSNFDKYIYICILGLSGFIFIVVLAGFSWICNRGIRERMIELENWKATYESGYCPTCGAYIGEVKTK